ncbi:class I SAM-dependent methyltransferase [Candidatus Bathyarchaeota archaeon]|nr:class I SAM-dependent methyltransferase [Candidatus Bathyarchaeota archaeon]
MEEGELYREELESRLERAEKEVEALLRIFSEEGVPPPKGRILDLCCGIGRHSVPLAERGYQVTGIDLSPVLIARARELAKARGVE